MRKRLWAVLLSFVLVFGAMTTATLGAEILSDEDDLVSMTVSDEVADVALEATDDVIASGSFGDDVTFYLTEEGVLHVEGRGEMWNIGDWGRYLPTPWTVIQGKWGFQTEKVYKVVVHEGITAIGEADFSHFVNMEEITLPSSLKKIGKYAFGNCPRLKELVIPGGVKEIDTWIMFLPNGVEDYGVTTNIGLFRIRLENGVENIGKYAFKGHNLKTIELNEGLKKIGQGVFYDCPDISTITIPDSVESIDTNAFKDCKSLISVSFGDASKLRELGDGAFSECKKLQSVYFPKSLIGLGRNVLSQCTDLYEILIPEGIVSLRGICDSCTGLERIALPSTVVGLNEEFSNCPSIKEIYYGGNREEWKEAGGEDNPNFKDATVFFKCDGFNNAALTVSFNSQGGTEVAPVTGVMYESKINLPEPPVRDNYSFAGWYTMTGGRGKAFTKDTLVTDNITLYAYWVSGDIPTPTPIPSGDDEIIVGDPIVLVTSEKTDISNIFSKSKLPDTYFVAPKGKASVSKRGILSAKKTGEVAVIATNGSEVLGIQKFVIQKPVMVKQITLRVGQTIGANTLLSGTTLGAEYSSSKPTVARIDTDGNIVGVAKGTAKIIATIHGKTYKTTVKVKTN